MGIVMDILLLATAFLIVFMGWKRGLIKSVIGLVCDAVSLVVAYALTPYLSGYICDNFVLGKVSEGIDATVRSAATGSAGADVSTFLTSIPETLAGVLTRYNVGDEALRNYISSLSDTGEEAVKKVSDFIARPTSQLISNALSFIAIFVVSLIVLRLLSKLIILIFKAPVLKTADRAAGVVFGLINALFVVWVLSLAISVGAGALGSYMPKWFGETVEHSFVLKFLSSYNPISVIKNVLEKVDQIYK